MPCGVSYCIPPISENFVRTSLQQLSTGKASRLDELCTYFLKVAASYISLSFTAILNLSISSGLFPNIRENSKVSPMHKAGSLFDRSNYCPISVQAIAPNIFECHIHRTFHYCLSQHEPLLQLGFHSYHLCELSMAYLSDNILTNIDNKLLSGLLLVDFKKVFDVVDHDTLLDKFCINGCFHFSMA